VILPDVDRPLGRYTDDPRFHPHDWGWHLDYGPGYALTVTDLGVWYLHRAGATEPANFGPDVVGLLDWLLGDPQEAT
jgi:hypothetical protein